MTVRALPQLRWATLAGAALLALALAGGQPAIAEEAADTTTSTAVGSTSDWSSEAAATGGGESLALDESQKALVGRIDAYFNGIHDLQGVFLQTDAQEQQSRGKFFLQRPGKFRFDYASPSTLVVVSDGDILAFEDHELKSVDNYPLDSTPFKLLLVDKVDLQRDGKIVKLTESADLVTIALQDKSGDNGGQIELYFAKAGEDLVLREWVITGPEGGDTRVELADLVNDKPVDPKLFVRAELQVGKGGKK